MILLQNSRMAENFFSPGNGLLAYLVFKCQRQNATGTDLELDLAVSSAYVCQRVCKNKIY